MYYKYNTADYDALLSKSKHSITIANVLNSSDDVVQHDALREAIGIKKNNLSNVIKKIVPFDILFITKVGKNVYYSLTPKGYEFRKYALEKMKRPVQVKTPEKTKTDMAPAADPFAGAILINKK